MLAALYPSYVNLDPFIDIDQLAALDGFVTERLERRISAAADLQFHTGPFLLDRKALPLPGSRMVALSRSRELDNYYDLDRTEIWEATPEAEEFAPLMEFIETLPFATTGRAMIMYDARGRAVPAHRDHDSVDLCHEFVWFRTNRRKPFYMLEPTTGERAYVAGHAAWFDTVNQFHGAEASGGLSFSIRVDGVFDDGFRRLIPASPGNAAAAPARWANV